MRRAKLLLAGIAVLLTVSALAPVTAQAAAPTWSVDQTMLAPPLPNGALKAVSCPASGTCVAVGYYLGRTGVYKTLIETLAGGRWSIMTSPNPSNSSDSGLYGVSCASATSCYAVGYATVGGTDVAVIQHLSGGTWSTVTAPRPRGATASYLNAVSCVSATSCVAVGQFYTSAGNGRPLVETLSGGTWSVSSAPNPTGGTNSYLSGVSCASASTCVAVGSGNPGGGNSRALVEVLSASTWSIQHIAVPAGSTSSSLSGVSCPSATACMAVGQYSSRTGANKLLATQLTGTSWALSPVKNVAGSSYSLLNAVSCSAATSCSAGGIVTGSDGRVKVFAETFTAGSWSVTPIQKPAGTDNNSELLGVSCMTVTSCVAVGDVYANGPEMPLAESYSGSTWAITATQKAPGPLNSQMLGVSCASTSMCMAVGAINVNTGTALAELWNGATWTITPTPNPDNSNAQLWSVSCPTTTFCVAVGDASGKPLGAVWNGTSWSLSYAAFPSGADSAALMSVSCPSTTLCFAAGWKIADSAQHGMVEKWNGSTWSVLTTPDPAGDVASALYGISCASSTSCVAVGTGPNPSFDYHSYALKFDGTTWTQTGAPGPAGLMGVSCPSSTYCVAVGFGPGPAATVWDGTSWTTTFAGSQNASFQSVSCTSTTACTAIGTQSTDTSQGTFAEQWDGVSWSVETSRNARGADSTDLEDVSCVPGLCYAVGSASGATNVPFAEYRA